MLHLDQSRRLGRIYERLRIRVATPDDPRHTRRPAMAGPGWALVNGKAVVTGGKVVARVMQFTAG